jgi:hypothetical protein
MFTVMDPETKDAEVYRNTPFEHETTADPVQICMTCATPIQLAQGWTAQAGIMEDRTTLNPAHGVDLIVEKLDWISAVLSQVQFEILEDAADINAARKALADPKNKVRVPLSEVKKRLGL